MDYQLVVLKGRSAAKTVRLADGTTTVGRQDGCELVLRSSQVSRKHCQLFEKKGLLLVKDLGSANGTFVDGKRIEEQRVLEPGNVLTIGPFELKVEATSSPATPAAGEASEVSSGTGERARPSDTSVPEQAETPIPLDDDDVLEFVIGDDEPAPPTKGASAPKPAATAKSSQNAEAAKASAKPAAAPAKAAAAPAKRKEEPAPEPEDEGANEAIAEFLMGIEVEEEDRR